MASQRQYNSDGRTDPDSTDVIRRRVPPHFKVLKRIGEEQAAAGGCFLCVLKKRSDKKRDPEYLRRYTCVVKVANGTQSRFQNAAKDGWRVETSQDRLRDEIHELPHLPNHPHIIKIYEHSTGGSDDVHPYIAMQAIYGYSVSDWYDHRQRASPAFLWHFAMQLATVVLFLHHGVSPQNPDDPPQILPSHHQDIRGPNVMLDTANRDDQGYPNVVLIDFGKACIQTQENANNGAGPNGKGFTKDIDGLCRLVHAMAHDCDPCIKENYKKGACNCGIQEASEDIASDFGPDDTDLNDMSKTLHLLVKKDKDEAARHVARKAGLVGFIQTASRRFAEAKQRERDAETLISNEDMISAVASEDTFDTNNTLTDRVIHAACPADWDDSPTPSPRRATPPAAALPAGQRRIRIGSMLRDKKLLDDQKALRRYKFQKRQTEQQLAALQLMVGNVNMRKLRPRKKRRA